LSAAFGGRGKKRLNRVFDAIGFIYHDYHYPLRGQKKKRKTTASAIAVESKGKKMKVLTHRPRYIEPAVVPKFGEGASSTAEARRAASISQSIEEPTVMPKTPLVEPVETKVDKDGEAKIEEIMKIPEILSPPTEAKLLKVQKTSAATPKRRMANMLETTKALSPAPSKKVAEAAKAQAEAKTGQAEAEATKIQVETETRPPAPVTAKPAAPEEKTAGQDMAERARSVVSEAQAEAADYIYRYASGKKLTEDEIVEARHYAQKLKYSQGALVFNGSNEDDFLYCLPDNKEISIFREIGKSMGFSKLEDGLSIFRRMILLTA
jgi:hypothetical protein